MGPAFFKDCTKKYDQLTWIPFVVFDFFFFIKHISYPKVLNVTFNALVSLSLWYWFMYKPFNIRKINSKLFM